MQPSRWPVARFLFGHEPLGWTWVWFGASPQALQSIFSCVRAKGNHIPWLEQPPSDHGAVAVVPAPPRRQPPHGVPQGACRAHTARHEDPGLWVRVDEWSRCAFVLPGDAAWVRKEPGVRRASVGTGGRSLPDRESAAQHWGGAPQTLLGDMPGSLSQANLGLPHASVASPAASFGGAPAFSTVLLPDVLYEVMGLERE